MGGKDAIMGDNFLLGRMSGLDHKEPAQNKNYS